MPKVTFVGDVHDEVPKYLQETEGLDRVIQVGDFLCGKTFFERYIPEHHRFIHGNHDDVRQYSRMPQFIDPGTFCHGVFCIGGSDHSPRHRKPMDLPNLDFIRAAYKEYLPEYVCSHTCPSVCGDLMTFGGYIEMPMETFLGELFMIHHPKLWVFGHWHKSWRRVINGTQFVCLNQVETFTCNIE